MDVVTGATESLISMLGKLLKSVVGEQPMEEYKLQTGLPKKIASLIKELECAHAALHNVARVPPDQLDEQVKIWAREVREASYDMEDILDTFLVDWLFGMMRNLFKRRKIAVAIDDIRDILDEVAARHRRYTAAEMVVGPAPPAVDPRLTAMYQQVTLIGIHKPKGKLISMLSSSQGDQAASNKKVKIVSVVGVGGLGKTTLVKAVYDEIISRYNCGAFVSVGRQPDLRKVLRDVLIKLNKKYMNWANMAILDEGLLIDELREYLGSKRYLIVIDDIWDTKSWKIIKCALVDGNDGSRIIATTRNSDVAPGEIYKLEKLSYENSKDLLCTRIFGMEGAWPDGHLDEVSDKILKKCDGVPLAIITMASLLVGKSREEWSEVCNCIAFSEKDNKQVSDTEWILSLSYYDLPPHLKTCLLYLSAFPENFVINKQRLIWKWVAEGFVHKNPGTGYFEVGERYFNELVNRSMIQTVHSERSGIVHGCRIHDMVLDLLRLISLEENFVITISNNDEGMLPPRSRVHRLAHQNRMVGPTRHDHHMDLGHLRSLIACSCDYKGLPLPSFGLLRVLVLENCKLMNGCIPLEHLENLVHLRYLGLRDLDISELPEEIGALKFLQTLDLDGTRMSDGVMEKLTSLEELHIRGRMWQFVKELGKLSELRVLKANIYGTDLRMHGESMHREMWGTGVLSRHLQHFIIEEPKYERVLSRHLQHFIIDEELKAQGLPRHLRQHLRHFIIEEPMAHIDFVLAACINPSDLPNLTHLDITVTPIEDQHLKILGELPELRHLQLDTDEMATNFNKVTVAGTAADCSFRKLRYCILPNSTIQFVLNEDSTVSLTLWHGRRIMLDFCSKRRDNCRAAPAIMANLEELLFFVRVEHIIYMKCSCDNLGLEYLPSLQKVRVFFMTRDTSRNGRKKVKDALTNAVEVHPNRSTIEFCYFSYYF
ncbi:hypothetical protein EJB05_57920, partial [Eragrostis curvula]